VNWIIEPGFFSNSAVQVALIVGAASAIVSGTVGIFTVIRGQSFAGHALADVSSTGGSGAFLLGLSPLWGFLVMGMAGAGLMEVLGVRRLKGRDLSTGIVLGAALGISALFLYWDTTFRNTTGATFTVLFGSVFSIDPSIVPIAAVLGALALLAVLVLYRPLLLSSLDSDLAVARGVRVRAVGAAYLAAMAVAVALSCLTIGAILSTALLIGPAAAALRLTKRIGTAIALACAIGTASMWLGVLLSYNSFYWPPAGRGWPVSFFVVALVLVFYIAAGLISRRSRRTRSAPEIPVMVQD
jgi:zinc/manganese transport system permease protein